MARWEEQHVLTTWRRAIRRSIRSQMSSPNYCCGLVNLRIEPVFGPKALAVSPRIGHIHVTVDGAPWHWADASGEPVILVGLPAGPHTVEIVLANANHQPLDRAKTAFVIPEMAASTARH